MATLRIEHAIQDYDLWQKAFDSFEQARAKAGVRSFVIRQPVDDPKYLMLDLEFDTQAQAESFAGFLHDRVWSSPASSPALAGRPQTRVLDLRRREELRRESYDGWNCDGRNAADPVAPFGRPVWEPRVFYGFRAIPP